MTPALRPLEQALSAGATLMVVYGDAAPLVEAAMARVREVVEPTVGPPAFNVSVHRAGEADGIEAFRTARTLPMMGPRRLVLVKELHLGDDAFYEAAAAYAEAPVAEAVVVLLGAGFPKVKKGSKDWRQRLKRAVGTRGLWLELSAKNVRADQYACEVASELGKQLSVANGRLLVEVLGDDLARIRQEVQKLSIYVGDAPTISADAIHEATAALAEAAIWDLTAALAAGDVDAALATLHRLQEGGDDPRRLLSMVAWQARDLLRMHARLRAGMSDSAIRGQVRMRPDVFRAAKQRMAERGFPHPGVMMGRLAKANLEMNSHRAGADRILERLVLDLVAAR